MSLLTVKGIAAVLNVSPKVIYEWSLRGEIPLIRVGRLLRFDQEAVLRHFAERTKETCAQPPIKLEPLRRRGSRVRPKPRSLDNGIEGSGLALKQKE